MNPFSLVLLLLAKDLRRAWRNPIPWLVHLSMPVLITALIGLAFSGSNRTGGMGRIKLAIVDEDDSVLTGVLRGALNQQAGGKYLEPAFLSRETALREITNNRLSAAVIVPRGFTRDYLLAEKPVVLELVKNPAQSFHPAIIEELMGALVTVLNAVSRNLQSEFPEWREILDRPGQPALREIGQLLVRAGEKLEASRTILFPPLVGYEKELRSEEKPNQSPGFNVFGFILPGLAAVFLFFLGDNAIRDLYRELRFRTLERFHTLNAGLFVFVLSKVLFALVVLWISGAILLGGGAWLFRFHWAQPAGLAILVVAYTFFVAGFMSFLAALAGSEKRADVLNTVIAMAMGLAGGCMFPVEQLPTFIRDHVTAWLPTHWFVMAVRTLQTDDLGFGWGWTTAKLLWVGLVLILVAAHWFHRRLERGIRE
jgi:ABC-2 type transport system permease protein